MRWRSRSMSSTLTRTRWPISRISDGCVTWLHESSEMWIRPSMPSRSTNAPKSTMFEIWPSTTQADVERVEDALAHLAPLLLEHRAARQHDVVARAVELDHAAAQRLAEELVQILHAADVDERRRQEAAHAEVDDEPALDDLDHEALDGLAALGGLLDAPPRLLEAGALLGEDQATLVVLLGEDESVDLVAERDLLGRVDVAADRQLGERDDAFRLVPHVDEDLVAIDAHDQAREHVALVEGDDLRVVIGHQLAVDLDPDSGLGDHDLSVRLGHIGRGFPQIPRGSARRDAAFAADCTEGRDLRRRVAR